MHNVLWENDTIGGDRWGWIQVENLQLKEVRQQAIISRHFKLLGLRLTGNTKSVLLKTKPQHYDVSFHHFDDWYRMFTLI